MRSNVADEEFIELPHRGLELLLQDHGYRVQEIELSRIQNFPNHPYPVREGRDMDELVESIRKMGQLESALLRELSPDSYQLLSGHRRKMALSLLGQNTMRAVIIPDLTDRQAEAVMLECNTRRDELLPSEKGRVYYDKKRLYQQMTAMEKQELRSLFGGSTPNRASAFAAMESADSEGQVKRYIRLYTSAAASVQALVDRGEMSLHTADELTSLSDEEQNTVASVVSEHRLHLSDRQLRRLKQAEGTLDEATVKHLLGVDRGDEPSGGRTPPLTMRAIRAFFPATMTKEQIDEELRRLLSAWQSGQK